MSNFENENFTSKSQKSQDEQLLKNKREPENELNKNEIDNESKI
jgi:hypothetical protein